MGQTYRVILGFYDKVCRQTVGDQYLIDKAFGKVRSFTCLLISSTNLAKIIEKTKKKVNYFYDYQIVSSRESKFLEAVWAVRKF